MKVHVIEGYGISSNIYVVEAESGMAAVIDAGTMEQAAASVERIRATGVVPRIMVLTHRHVDHTGGANRISGAFGIKEIYAGARDCEAIRNADATTGAGAFGLGIEPVGVIPVSDGDSIDVGNESLLVMETPGHTAGSISLLDRAEKALFPGDTVFADGGVGRWDLPTGSLKELEHSVKRLSAMDITSLYPGHGHTVVSGATEHISLSLAELRYYSSTA